MNDALTFYTLTSERWKDLETLFGSRGACGGCWCMWWKLKRSEFINNRGEKNRAAFQSLVHSNTEPGIIAYSGNQPIGWIALAPRSNYPILSRSRILKPVDEEDVWSITCFFVKKEFRRMGVTSNLLEFAKSFVKDREGMILEGYPIEPKNPDSPDVFVFTGLASAFLKSGFTEVARRSETRPIMRCYLNS